MDRSVLGEKTFPTFNFPAPSNARIYLLNTMSANTYLVGGRASSRASMTVELVLTPIAKKPFAQVYPFQLFQFPQKSEIWGKVSPHYACIISQQLSCGRSFQADEIVILLSPYSDEEQ